MNENSNSFFDKQLHNTIKSDQEKESKTNTNIEFKKENAIQCITCKFAPSISVRCFHPVGKETQNTNSNNCQFYNHFQQHNSD